MTVDGTFKIVEVRNVLDEKFLFIDENGDTQFTASMQEKRRCEALSLLTPFHVDYFIDYNEPNPKMKIMGFRFHQPNV